MRPKVISIINVGEGERGRVMGWVLQLHISPAESLQLHSREVTTWATDFCTCQGRIVSLTFLLDLTLIVSCHKPSGSKICLCRSIIINNHIQLCKRKGTYKYNFDIKQLNVFSTYANMFGFPAQSKSTDYLKIY